MPGIPYIICAPASGYLKANETKPSNKRSHRLVLSLFFVFSSGSEIQSISHLAKSVEVKSSIALESYRPIPISRINPLATSSEHIMDIAELVSVGKNDRKSTILSLEFPE